MKTKQRLSELRMCPLPLLLPLPPPFLSASLKSSSALSLSLRSCWLRTHMGSRFSQPISHENAKRKGATSIPLRSAGNEEGALLGPLLLGSCIFTGTGGLLLLLLLWSSLWSLLVDGASSTRLSSPSIRLLPIPNFRSVSLIWEEEALLASSAFERMETVERGRARSLHSFDGHGLLGT